MSEYPIKVALATVALACFIGWINAWIKPGNYIGAPGVAAGWHRSCIGCSKLWYGNMAFVFFFNCIHAGHYLEIQSTKYILLAVPEYLVEGLLAGVD